MRIAIVLSALQAGGAERVINLLSTAAVLAGWHVTIISFDRAGDPIFHQYDRRVEFVRLGIPAGARFVPRRVIALRRTLRSGNFDRIVSFLAKINVVTLAAVLGLRSDVTVSERNNPRLQPMHPLWRMALALLYARADTIVMQTSSSVACLPKRYRSRALIIPNPVELPPRKPHVRGLRQLVAVGRLTEQKGFDLLIAAFAKIVPEHPEWKLTIWGDGPARSSLERQVAELELGHCICLPGLSARPGGWSEHAEIFALSSRYEGFPNALLEAMATGLAVVAFDCDFGPAELIEHERTGLLIPNGATDALCQSLASLMLDEQQRRRLGRAARSAAARFAGDRVTGIWLAHLSSSPHDVEASG
jgi:glycosyltransferase involved in cell wall biosynthesis